MTDFIINHEVDYTNYTKTPNTVICGVCGQIQTRSVKCVVCENNLLVTFDSNNGNTYYRTLTNI